MFLFVIRKVEKRMSEVKKAVEAASSDVSKLKEVCAENKEAALIVESLEANMKKLKNLVRWEVR